MWQHITIYLPWKQAHPVNRCMQSLKDILVVNWENQQLFTIIIDTEHRIIHNVTIFQNSSRYSPITITNNGQKHGSQSNVKVFWVDIFPSRLIECRPKKSSRLIDSISTRLDSKIIDSVRALQKTAPDMIGVSLATVGFFWEKTEKHNFAVTFCKTADPCLLLKSQFFWQTARLKVA